MVMNIDSQLTQVGSQPGVAQAAQITVLNKAKSIAATTALPLLESAVQSADQIRASNPANLGQNVDVRA
jgi:hypothetical protein